MSDGAADAGSVASAEADYSGTVVISEAEYVTAALVASAAINE